MTRIFKQILALFFTIAFLSTNFTIFIYAEGIEENEDFEEREHYNALIKATNREELTFDEKQWLFGDGDKITGIISAEEVKAFNQGTASFSFGIDLNQILKQHRTSPEFDLYAAFVLYEGAGKFYTCEFSVLDDPVIAADEIRKTAKSGLRGISRRHGGLMDSDEKDESDTLSENTRITGIQIFELMNFNREWLETQPSDYTAIINSTAFIQKFAVIDSTENGWHEYNHDQWNAPKKRGMMLISFMSKRTAPSRQAPSPLTESATNSMKAAFVKGSIPALQIRGKDDSIGKTVSF